MRFQLYQDSVGDWRWMLWASNDDDVVAVSSEGYRHKADCLKVIQLVKQAHNAPVYGDRF